VCAERLSDQALDGAEPPPIDVCLQAVGPDAVEPEVDGMAAAKDGPEAVERL
jgi:hypothetical protein